jgi:hypothetical protein
MPELPTMLKFGTCAPPLKFETLGTGTSGPGVLTDAIALMFLIPAAIAKPALIGASTGPTTGIPTVD